MRKKTNGGSNIINIERKTIYEQNMNMAVMGDWKEEIDSDMIATQ